MITKSLIEKNYRGAFLVTLTVVLGLNISMIVYMFENGKNLKTLLYLFT